MESNIPAPDETKRRRVDKKGRVIALELLDGMRIVGTLEKYDASSLFVRDFKEPQFQKEIRRNIVKRYVVIV